MPNQPRRAAARSPEAKAMIDRSNARRQQETARQNLGDPVAQVTASERVAGFLEAWGKKRDRTNVIYSLHMFPNEDEGRDLLASDLGLLLAAAEDDSYAEGYTAGRRDLAEYLSRLADRLRHGQGV